MKDVIYTKTWVRTRLGVNLRCYIPPFPAKDFSKIARACAKEMAQAVPGSRPKPDPNELLFEQNKFGMFLSWTIPWEETLPETLKKIGFKGGNSLL